MKMPAPGENTQAIGGQVLVPLDMLDTESLLAFYLIGSSLVTFLEKRRRSSRINKKMLHHHLALIV